MHVQHTACTWHRLGAQSASLSCSLLGVCLLHLISNTTKTPPTSQWTLQVPQPLGTSGAQQGMALVCALHRDPAPATAVTGSTVTLVKEICTDISSDFHYVLSLIRAIHLQNSLKLHSNIFSLYLL